MIRVLLVDDHELVLTGLEALLGSAPDIEIVGTAADGRSAVEAVALCRPNVVVMDISLPELDGIEATRQILDADDAGDGDVKVVMLTAHSERHHVARAIAAGATGYLLKDADPDDLADGIRAAAKGDAPLDPRAAKALIPERDRSVTPRLSRRKLEVLRLVGAGLANKRIAHRLGISERTVKAHLTGVFAAIGVTDRTQAALWARDRGILER